MKVYRIECCEGYRWGYYSDDNSLSNLDAGNMLLEAKLNFNGGIPFKFDFFHEEHKKMKKKLGDFMYTNISGFRVVNERTKEILQPKYGDFIWFIPLEGTDEYGNKYYSFLPSTYVEGFDVKRLEFEDGHEYDEIYSLRQITKYCFKDIVKDYPVFRIKRSYTAQKNSASITKFERLYIFVLEEFVRFVKENDLTGFEFKEVYNSETFDSIPKTAEETQIPVSEINTINRRNITMENQMIPMTHEDGIFSPCDLSSQTGECLEIEYNDCGMITNNANKYIIYQMDGCDMSINDMEVTYSSGRLEAVYVSSDKGKIPVYMNFDFSSGSDPENLTKAVNECVELCAADLLNALKNADTPIAPLSLECFCDGEAYGVNLQDRDCNIYSVEGIADRMLCCICICAQAQCPYNGDYGYELFNRILNDLHKKLSDLIPEQFDVTEDFEVSEPQMYD